MIYLDNAATTAVSKEVLDAMMPYLTREYGNPGSTHSLGARAAQAVENAREQVLDFVGGNSCGTIIFTSSGSEANNLAIIGSSNYMDEVGRRLLVTSFAEHSSVLNAMTSMCSKNNGSFFLRRVRPDNTGCVSPDKVFEVSNVGLASIMYVNNEVGTVNPVAEIGKMCRKTGALFHTDCVQAAGAYKLDAEEIGCDFMSISSHKIHGPKGVGALYVRDSKILNPVIFGSASQEYGLRGGTENVAGIVGFGRACAMASKNLEENIMRTTMYKKKFYEILCSKGLSGCVHVNGLRPEKPGRILNLTVNGVDAETLIAFLNLEGVCISAGSACTAHESEPSHVLSAMGLTPSQARNSVRISFSEDNIRQDVEKAAYIFVECVQNLRNM